MRQMSFVVLLLLMICSCKTTEVVEVLKTDTTFVDRLRVDSVRQIDSVYLHEYIKGDTIVKETTKVVYRDKVRIKVDTVYTTTVETKEMPIHMEKPSVWAEIGDVLNKAKWLIVVMAVALVVMAVVLVVYRIIG